MTIEESTISTRIRISGDGSRRRVDLVLVDDLRAELLAFAGAVVEPRADRQRATTVLEGDGLEGLLELVELVEHVQVGLLGVAAGVRHGDEVPAVDEMGQDLPAGAIHGVVRP
jgi:hypothetical protein